MSSFVLIVLVAGLLYSNPVTAMPADLCAQGLHTVPEGLLIYFKQKNKDGFQQLCAVYKEISEDCDFNRDDKEFLQKNYKMTCETEKVHKWLSSSGTMLQAAVTSTLIAFLLTFRMLL